MSNPLPKREYNLPPAGFIPIIKVDDKHEPCGPLQRELQKIRRELLTLAQRVEKLTTGQETA